MKVRVEVVSLNADGEQQRRQILTIERRELTMEALGMNLTEAKALLSGGTERRVECPKNLS
jgi:hypothetical protein